MNGKRMILAAVALASDGIPPEDFGAWCSDADDLDASCSDDEDAPMRKPCLVCGHITTGSRCPAHRLVRIRHRPGHRAAHAKARAQLSPLVDAGADCSRCGQPILPSQLRDADERPNGFEPSQCLMQSKRGRST
jgi:hypothetical protein